MKNIGLVLGVLFVGVTAAMLARPPAEAGVMVAARELIAAQRKVPSCADLLGAVLTATAGEVK